MKIMVVGGGAREHALVWKLSQSPKVNEILVAPGNAGTGQIAHNIDVAASDISGLVRAARGNRVDLTVVGPEGPLAAGIVEQFMIRGMQIFGPTREAARIESSKVFAKKLMEKYGIPCARSASFSEYGQAKEYVLKQTPPIVVKADGLAAGKGVIIATTIPQAVEALVNIMEVKVFGGAGDKVLIEEYLEGREMSAFAFSDAHSVVPMVPACDYKRVFDGDQGPNTGGMGGYSPPSFFTPELGETVTRTIMVPTVTAMHQEGKPYKGVLYAGLTMTADGPRVLEFNARFGDPEAQVTLPRLGTDLVDIMMAVADNTLGQADVHWSEDACVGVVLASGGYPGSFKLGIPITGLESVDNDVNIFHAGTKLDGKRVLTSGGRVLTVVATGKTTVEAREKVYANIPRIRFEGCHYRKDIALNTGR